MFPFSKSHGASETTPDTFPHNAGDTRDPAMVASYQAQIRTRAEVHADSVLRGRTEFDRHHVRAALISAFISGADYVDGHATEQPAPAGERPELTPDELAERERQEREQQQGGEGGEH